MLHFSVLKSSPEHVDPLQDGVGLVQVRVKFLTPPPHWTEHSPGPQSDHPPSTETSNRVLLEYSVNIVLASAALRVASESHAASSTALLPIAVGCRIATRSTHD